MTATAMDVEGLTGKALGVCSSYGNGCGDITAETLSIWASIAAMAIG